MKSADQPSSAQARRSGERDRRRADTRAAVIEAAIRLFAQRGFDGTSLPAIAQLSGVPVPLAMYHFKSKEGLWREAVAAVYARVEAHIAEFAERIEQAKGIEFYRVAATAHITALAAHPEHMRILFQEGTQESERLAWLVDRHQSRLSAMQMAIIERAQGEGLFPPMDVGHAKFLVSGAFSLPIVLAPEFRIVTGDDSQSAEFIRRHVDACLRVILPAAFPKH